MWSRYDLFCLIIFGRKGIIFPFITIIHFVVNVEKIWRDSDCETLVGVLAGDDRGGLEIADILVGQVGLEPTTGRL